MSNPTRKKQGKPASDNHTLVELGQLLAQRRRDSGIVQQDLAKTVGVSRSTLHTIEHGGEGVRWEKVVAVAHALNLDIEFVPQKSVSYFFQLASLRTADYSYYPGYPNCPRHRRNPVNSSGCLIVGDAFLLPHARVRGVV